MLVYANERLLAAYGAPPVFDRYDAAAAILERCGVDEDARSDARQYVISGDNPNIAKRAFGDLVDEFLDRADWVGLNGAWMNLPTGARLKPRDERQRAEDAFNESLPSNAWVVATAKEGLRRERFRHRIDAVHVGRRPPDHVPAAGLSRRNGGVPVASRLTVSGTKGSLSAIEAEDDDVFLAWSDFKTKFHQNFGFYVQDRTMTRQLASDAMVVLDFYGRLYQRSATFRRMFDEMPVTEASQAHPWKFGLEGDIEFDLLSSGAHERGMSEPAKKIYVLDNDMRYLTETGLREVEIERTLAYQMICAMAGLRKLPPAQAMANRGPAVYLTDKILLEAGFNYPRQLAAALVGPDDAAAQARLLAQQTSAMRSAATEDQYMMLS